VIPHQKESYAEDEGDKPWHRLLQDELGVGDAPLAWLVRLQEALGT
jgi:hypothetical protein